MGLVLRAVKVGEADQILTVLTPERGAVSIRPRQSAAEKQAVQCHGLFCYSEFAMTSGRSQFY